MRRLRSFTVQSFAQKSLAAEALGWLQRDNVLRLRRLCLIVMRELHDHAVEELDNHLVIGLRIIRGTANNVVNRRDTDGSFR
jgi:hypothetical protein